MTVTAPGQVEDLPDRKRLAKLIGMLGSSSAGERANALAAFDKALIAAALSWGWLADLIERGQLPDGDTARMFKMLVIGRLRESLPRGWGMREGEAAFVRDVLVRCESGASDVDLATVSRALEIAARVSREAR